MREVLRDSLHARHHGNRPSLRFGLVFLRRVARVAQGDLRLPSTQQAAKNTRDVCVTDATNQVALRQLKL